MTKTSRKVFNAVHKTVGIAAAERRINLSSGEQLGVMSIEQFIFLQSIREVQQILHGRIYGQSSMLVWPISSKMDRSWDLD
jgi:hypothetical protein